MTGIAVLLAASRIAVVACGADGRTAGALASAIERPLADHGYAVRTPAEIAAAIGRRDALDPNLAERVAPRWDEVKQAYYTEHPDRALEALTEIAELYDRHGPVPVAERVRLLLWRSAVYLARDDRERGAAEARAALELAPDLVVDLHVFKPSVARMVDDLRSAAPPPPAPRLPPETAQLVCGVAFRGTASPVEREPLDALARAVGADVVVLAGLRGDPPTESRVALWWRGGPLAPGPLEPAGGNGYDALAAWTIARLDQGTPSADAFVLPSPSPSPVPGATPRPPPPPRDAGDGVSVRVAALAATRAYSVEGGPASYSSGFEGVGLRAHGDLVRGRLAAEADLHWISWISRVRVQFNDGSPDQVVDGGASDELAIAAGLGWERSMDEPGFRLLAGAFTESLQTRDAARASGRAGVFPAQRRTGLRVFARAHFPVPVGRRAPVVLGGMLGVEPWSAWSESPANASGSSPTGLLEPCWGASASLPFADRWGVLLEYEGQVRAAHFRGEAIVPVGDPIQDATVRETRQTLSFSVQRRF